MSIKISSGLLAPALAVIAMGCAQASAKQTQAPKPASGQAASGQAASGQAAASAAKPAGAAAAGAAEKKTIAATVKNMKKHDGLFTVYQDTANGSVMVSVSKDKIGKEFVYFTHIVDAPVTAGMFRGAFGSNNVFTVRRHFNRLEFVTQNDGFWFDSGNALSRAASANISPAVFAVQEIAGEDSTTFLIKGDDLFLTEAFAQVKPTANPTARPGENFTLGTLSKGKTRVTRVKNYPLNTDVTVEYVYENPAPWNRGNRDITDARNVTIAVQHSLIEMPKNGYVPRFDDPRVGYFTQEQTDQVSVSAAPYRDLINRWHLVKKDPSAALSDPVEPITWWIENTTPVEFRDAIAKGVLAWNPAFEAAGFRNAMVVKIQPDDADWDAGDMRYNVLRWTSSPNPPFGGYGPSFVNPRTGQILGADIMLEYIFVTNRVRQEKAFGTAALGMESMDEESPAKFCSLADQLQLNVLAGRQALVANGASQIEMRDYINQAVVSLVLHEVGHTLGLNHNMKASQMLSPKEINDRSITGRVGGMGSVMDYDIVNLARKGQTQGDFFAHKAGPYDVWAIQFGYTPALTDASAERARQNALLARSTESALAFGNDADDMRSAGGGIDPRVNTNDMTNDAIGYASERFEIIDDLMKTLPARYSAPGQSYHEMRNAYLVLSGQQNISANVISR
ncbi:MAG: zinc-dependent metalloprotease [Gemmatimonadaceae bacterium]|nr:zinc-dependent metalloprotease [Gemmatimonadaceae bacterium]